MSNSAKGFFDGTRPGKQAKHGEASFELPILYLRDDFFGLYYTADRKKVCDILPSDKLTPVTMPNGRAVIAIMAWNYVETSIGSYGEVPVAIPVLFEKKQLPLGGGFLPLMLQGAYPGFGVLVMHLPVTKVIARDAGRGEWGYTKFVADMDFNITPEFLECRMYEKDQFILDLKVMRRGFHMPDNKPAHHLQRKGPPAYQNDHPHKRRDAFLSSHERFVCEIRRPSHGTIHTGSRHIG